MSSTTPRRVPAASTTSTGGSGRRVAPGGATTPSTTAGVLSSNGTAGSPSPRPGSISGRPARPAGRRPLAGSASNAEEEAKAGEARAETTALVDSLRQSLKEAEASSEDYKRQLAVAQEHMDNLMVEQTRLEEQFHASSARVQELELDQSESRRHAQEMERIYDGERSSMIKDHEEAVKREHELKGTIHRLKETVAEREFQLSSSAQGAQATGSTIENMEGENEPQYAPPTAPRQDSLGNRNLVMKDQIIENLRLELADAQIKLIEMENAGGDRLHELEKTLLETRMANARLQEDNESFQLLLGERTISGDFQKTQLMQGAGGSETGPAGLGSLAEELQSAAEEFEPTEGGSLQARRLEAELKSVKDQNKALTLYIEKIISRVLQHDNFETILDQKGGLGRMPGSGGGGGGGIAATEKELPPPPPAKDERPSSDGFLQRATSVVRRQRPVSAMFAGGAIEDPNNNNNNSTTLTARNPRPLSSSGGQFSAALRQPTANEDPLTAPSIPLGRASSVSTKRGGRSGGHVRMGSIPSGIASSGLAHSSSSAASAPASAQVSSPDNPPPPQQQQQQQRTIDLPGAAGIVNQMYRGPAGRSDSPSAPPLSPLMSPSGTRGAYFGSGAAGAFRSSSLSGSSVPGAADAPRASSESVTSSRHTAGRGSTEEPSGDGAAAASDAASVTDASSTTGPAASSPSRDRAANTQYTGAVMQQNRLRPLRLVQEAGAEDAAALAARKKANRSSWMGWFNRGPQDPAAPAPPLGPTEE